jgi:hypothetical protein
VAQELTLSFVPDAEQRLWRTVMRRKYQVTRNRVQLHNRLESLLEEAHIKLSSLVSDLLGASARRMLQALADGETDPATLASLADTRLRATAAQLSDAFGACTTLHPVYRRLLKLTLDELRLIEDHLGHLDQQMADLLAQHHDAVRVDALFNNPLWRRRATDRKHRGLHPLPVGDRGRNYNSRLMSTFSRAGHSASGPCISRVPRMIRYWTPSVRPRSMPFSTTTRPSNLAEAPN